MNSEAYKNAVIKIPDKRFKDFSQKNVAAKKRRPEKTTTPCLSACYTSHIGATKQGAVRTFSGLLPHILKP